MRTGLSAKTRVPVLEAEDHQSDGNGNSSKNCPKPMLFSDPPAHTRMRGLVNKAFTPRVVEAMAPRIQTAVDQYLDAVLPRGQMDIIYDLASPLPVVVIAEMLGVPAEDRLRFKEWSDAMTMRSSTGQGTLTRAN